MIVADVPIYPGYDVLDKRSTPSWNAATRRVIDQRLATPDVPRFLTALEWKIADALCQRILPQGGEQDAALLVALLDAKLFADHGDGFREGDMPYMREAWRQGLAAVDAEAKKRFGRGFAGLCDADQDALLNAMQAGNAVGEHWPFSAKTFFERRMLADIPALYYSLPKAWNEIGFGGPASPRGYVRLDGDRRDAWEAAEAGVEGETRAELENRHVV